VLSLILAAHLLAIADPAPATEGGPTVPAAAAQPAKPKSDKVCWDEAPTGSHYTRHYCASREELEQRERQDKDSLNQHTRTRGKSGLGPS